MNKNEAGMLCRKLRLLKTASSEYDLVSGKALAAGSTR